MMALCLFLAGSTVKGAWQDDANARIEQIRKRNAEILVVDLGGNPITNVSVQSDLIDHSFAFGTCIAYGALTGGSQANYRNYILGHFNYAVCENESKWPANEWNRDSESYTEADYIYNFCSSNGIRMRGHCLFWEQSSQIRQWVKDLPYATYPTSSELLTEVDERIDSAVNHFKGKFHHWDVDNEMLPSGSDYRFYDRLGDGGRVHMFQRAHSVDPNCLLFVNEYTDNSFGGYNGQTQANRINQLIALGAPIHGIGIQGHVASPFNPDSYWTNVLERLRTGVGLPIWVTEFDVEAANVTQRATDLENFYRICFSHPSVEGIIMWGFWDGSQWRADAQLVETNWTINAAGQRYEQLLAEWTTSDSNTSNTSGKVNFRGFHGTYDITLTASGHPAEVKTIELEPGSTTQQFILQMNFSGVPDNNAPTPNPMTWASNPAPAGPYSITMTATTATDNSGVEYFFDCTAGGGHDSNWQSSPTYQDTGLTPNTQYTYQVKARDKSSNHNETAFSVTRSATTWPPDTTAPTPNPMTWSVVPTATGAYSITMTATTATDANNPPVQYYFECTN